MLENVREAHKLAESFTKDKSFMMPELFILLFSSDCEGQSF